MMSSDFSWPLSTASSTIYNLRATGDTTVIDTETFAVEDSLMQLGYGAVDDKNDGGFGISWYGTGATRYSGLIRSASDKVFRLCEGLSAFPEWGTTTNPDVFDLSLGDLKLRNLTVTTTLTIPGTVAVTSGAFSSLQVDTVAEKTTGNGVRFTSPLYTASIRTSSGFLSVQSTSIPDLSWTILSLCDQYLSSTSTVGFGSLATNTITAKPGGTLTIDSVPWLAFVDYVNAIADGIIARGLFDLTADEVTQLGNINSTTISTSNWGYLASTDQNVATTSPVTHASLLLSGTLSCGTNAATVGALSASSLLSSGTLSCGTNAATVGALTCTSINGLTAQTVSASRFLAAVGAASSPAFSFTGYSDSGLYASISGTNVSLVSNVNGTAGLIVGPDSILTTPTVSCNRMRTAIGSASGPGYSFGQASNSGLYATTAGALVMAVNGSSLAALSDTSFSIATSVGAGTNNLSCGNLSCGAILASGGTVQTDSDVLLTGTARVKVPAGSATQPSYAFSSATSSGAFLSGTAGFCIASNAGSVATFDTSGITFSKSVTAGTNAMTCGALTSTSITASGSVSCGTNALTCGALSSAAISTGTSAISCGSIGCASIQSSSTFRGTSGAATNPTYSFSTGSGLYLSAAGPSIAYGGTQVFEATQNYIKSPIQPYVEYRVANNSTMVVGTSTPTTIGSLSLTTIATTVGFSTPGNMGSLTIPQNGVYLFTGTLSFAANSTGQRIFYAGDVGTGTITRYYGVTMVPNAGASLPTTMTISFTASLNASTVLYFYVEQNSGGNLNVGDVSNNVTTRTQFSCRYLV